MFPKKVFVQQCLSNRCSARVHRKRLKSGVRNFFEHHCVMRRLGHRSAPRKWRVTGNQNARHQKRIHTLESPHDGMARIGFVGIFDFRLVQMFRDRDRSIKIVGMSGAEARDFPARLSPDSGVSGMCMGYASDLREGAIEYQMGS